MKSLALGPEAIQSWQAIDLMMQLYPAEERAIAELLVGLSQPQRIATFGLAVELWAGEGERPEILLPSVAPTRIGPLFWNEIPASRSRGGVHLQGGDGGFQYAHWATNEFGFQWTLIEEGRPDYTYLQRYEFVGIVRYTLDWFIASRRAQIESLGPATEDEMRAFVLAYPGEDGHKAWDQFKDEFQSRAGGVYGSFKVIWKDIKGDRGRGRRRKMENISK